MTTGPPAPDGAGAGVGSAEGSRRSGHRILVNTAYRASADVGSKLASLALYVVMARELGDAGFGVFTFGLMYMTIFTSLAYFGQDPILIREVSRDRRALDRLFANVLALKTTLALPAAALALAGLVLVGSDGTTLAVCAALGVAVTAEALLATPFAVFQALDRMALIPVVLVTQRFATAAVGIAALLAGADVIAVALIYLAGTLAALGFALALQFSRVVRPALTVDPRRWRSFMAVAAPIGLAGVFGTVLFRADTVLLAAFEPAAVVGDYAAAYRLFETTNFLAWSIAAAVYPLFARLDEPGALREVLERSLKLAATLAFPFAVGAAVAAEPVVDLLYGDEFDDAATALRLLAPAIALFPLGYVTAFLLVGRGRQRWVAILYALVAVENIGLNLVLIPAYSLDGAAIGTSISEAILALVTLALAVRLVGRLDWVRAFAGPVAASAAAALVMLALLDRPWLGIAVGGCAYLVTAFLLERRFYPEDADALLNRFRR